MSPLNEPMTFDELSELYRIEMKSNSIPPVRSDLFRAMADLETRLRLEYDRQMSIDPESVMCEGANQHRKKAELLVKNILHIRTQKICLMAIRGAMGADNGLENLTAEEKDYYAQVQSLSRRHLLEVDRLRGRKVTVATRIDEPRGTPVRDEMPEPEPERPQEPVRERPAEEVPPQDGAAPPEDEAIPPADEGFDDFPEDSFDEFPDEPFDPPVPEGNVPAETPREPAPAPKEEIVEDVPDAPLDTPEQPAGDELEIVIIRILEDLPPFVGPDRDYLLKKEDLVTMPRIMAEALVNGEKAVLVRPSP